MITINWPEFLKWLAWGGSGAMIAVVMIHNIYRLADKIIEKFVGGCMTLGQEFIAAQKEQACSLAKMAQGTEGLRDAINEFVRRDNNEHREMIILLKYTREQIEQMTESMECIAKHIKGATS